MTSLITMAFGRLWVADRPISDIHEVEHLAAKLTVLTVLAKRNIGLPMPS